MDPFNLDQSHAFQEQKQVVIEPALSKAAFDAYTKNPSLFKSLDALLLGKKKLAGFNLFACIFCEGWCVYRKMYKLAALVLIVSAIVAVSAVYIYIAFFDASYQGKRHAIAFGYLSMLALVHIPFGFIANKLYFNKAKADIQSAIDQDLSPEYFTAQIKSAGGINVGGFIAVLGISMLIAKLTGS